VVHRQHYRADGELREVEIYASPMSSGGRTLLHAIIIDVTAWMEAEKGRRRLAAILDQTPESSGCSMQKANSSTRTVPDVS